MNCYGGSGGIDVMLNLDIVVVMHGLTIKPISNLLFPEARNVKNSSEQMMEL